MAGLDLVASVPTFPQPDTKVRTESLLSTGGGNTANSLTALRRLGISVSLLSQVGADPSGSIVLSELERDGIDASLIIPHPNFPTSLTYVVVATDNATRTCIATVPPDLSPDVVHADLLDGVSLVILDGRHTLAAIALAKLAVARGVPVLLDVERDRPHIRDLLPLADIIVTNSSYPLTFFPEAPDLISAMRYLRQACKASLVITTRGEKGSILIGNIQDNLSISQDLPLKVQSRIETENLSFGPSVQILECPAWPDVKVVDTTGAGDAFIGAVAYGIVTGLTLPRMLCLAALVAAKSVSAMGSRAGQPRRETIPSPLLSELSTAQ